MQKLRKLLDSNAFVRVTRNKKEEKEDCNTSTSVTITPVAGSQITYHAAAPQTIIFSISAWFINARTTPRRARRVIAPTVGRQSVTRSDAITYYVCRRHRRFVACLVQTAG